MKIRNAIRFLFLLSLCHSANADEVDVALGIFNLVRDGGDIQLSYRAENSYWQYFLRYMQFEDLFVDPYSGNEHSKTKDVLLGPGVNYLFHKESRHSAYVGISLLQWTRTETPILVTGPPNMTAMTASRWDPYFGGGYQGRFASHGYYNAGIFLAPTAKMRTQTAISSEEQSGNFDIQLQVGLAW
jgi:hypothetical protein